MLNLLKKDFYACLLFTPFRVMHVRNYKNSVSVYVCLGST